MPREGRDNPNRFRVYDPNGIGLTLDRMDGGGREPHIPVMFGIDYNEGGAEREVSNCLTTRYDAGVSKHKQEGTAVAITIPIALTSNTSGLGGLE